MFIGAKVGLSQELFIVLAVRDDLQRKLADRGKEVCQGTPHGNKFRHVYLHRIISSRALYDTSAISLPKYES
jgi:hypothetical protein